MKEINHKPSLSHPDTNSSILKVISDYANGLSRVPDEDLYAYIVMKMKKITGASMGLVTSYDRNFKELVCRYTSFSEKDNNAIYKLLGRKAVGTRIPVSEQFYTEIIQTAIKKHKNLSESTYGEIPSSVNSYFEKLLNIDCFMGIALIHDNQLIGTLLLIGREDQMITDKDFLMSFTAITANAIELKQASRALEESREWYRTIAEDVPAMVARVSPDYYMTFVNKAYCNFMGVTVEKIINRPLSEFVPADNYHKVINHFTSLTPDKPIDHHEHANTAYDGSERCIRWINRALYDASGSLKEYLCIGEDITDYRNAYQQLKKSEETKSSILEASPDIIIRFDREGYYLDVLSGDDSMIAIPQADMIGKVLEEVLAPELASLYRKAITRAINTGELQTIEYVITINEQAYEREARLKADSDQEVITFIRDITEKKRFEEKLKFLSMHDQLTGLYNRAFFEEEMKRLDRGRSYPITMLSADLDDLKLVNDSMGHDAGDKLLVKAANILKKSVRGSDILARVGGDEFTVILPRTDPETGEEIAARIRLNVEEYNNQNPEMPLGLSIGLATAEESNIALQDIFKKADDHMYHDKLHRSNRVRTKTVEALLAALAERDHVMEGHTERLADICRKIGQEINLSSRQLSDLALLAQVHDLGKVGIPDKILFKEGPLTDEEWKTMRLHPEKGYRIAVTSPDLSGVAELILKHHERWDGNGYPLGLKGTEIPVECRILSIVDAFDAMTNDRPYSKAVSYETALKEILNCAGTQFDPDLTDVFVTLFCEENNLKQLQRK